MFYLVKHMFVFDVILWLSVFIHKVTSVLQADKPRIYLRKETLRQW